MKKATLIIASLALGASLAGAAEWASIFHSLIAFDERTEAEGGHADGNRPGYVKPIINNIGAVLNSNWAADAGVPESFTFEAGMPFAIVPITSDDRSYAGGAPTIFGGKDYEWGTMASSIGSDMSCNAADCHVVNGNENLNGLPLFTYPYLQLAGSYYHARLVLRGMWLPSVSELKGFNLLGFGLQYSFGHFFQYKLPKAAQGFDVSLLFGYNSSGIKYQPEDYDSPINLDVTALNFSLILGYKPIQAIDIMLTLGYQYAGMESSGDITSNAEGSRGAHILPTLSVKGNNGFKFGLEVAFAIGDAFHPILGYNYNGKSTIVTNVLYFKSQFGKDKTPAEIAKEKGAAVDEDEDEEEPAKSSKKQKKSKKRKVEEDDDAEEESAIDEEEDLDENEDAEEIEEKRPASKKKKKSKKSKVVEEDQEDEDEEF